MKSLGSPDVLMVSLDSPFQKSCSPLGGHGPARILVAGRSKSNEQCSRSFKRRAAVAWHVYLVLRPFPKSPALDTPGDSIERIVGHPFAEHDVE